MFVSRKSANADSLANVAAQYSLEPTLFDSGRTTTPLFFLWPISFSYSLLSYLLASRTEALLLQVRTSVRV